jgi:hypothetical protein
VKKMDIWDTLDVSSEYCVYDSRFMMQEVDQSAWDLTKG